MKIYEAIFNEESSKGVFGISLVENPAMEDEWITLSEHPKEIQLTAVDDKKKILLGAVLIPNKRVYRNINGNEFEMTFSSDTIEKLAHNFQKQSYQNNSSLEHDVALSDVTFVETWTVENPMVDKSANYGKQYEKGTWVAMSKVSDETYEKAKKGEIKGFSIDALLGLTEVKFKNDNSMTKQDFLDAFKTLFTTEKVEEAVVEVKEVEVAVAEKEAIAEPQLDAESILETVTQMKSHFDKQIEEMKAEFSTTKQTLEKENAELKVELSKQPEAAPIKNKGEGVHVALTAKGRVLETLRTQKNNK